MQDRKELVCVNMGMEMEFVHSVNTATVGGRRPFERKLLPVWTNRFLEKVSFLHSPSGMQARESIPM